MKDALPAALRKGLLKETEDVFSFACAYAGEGDPDTRDEQLSHFELLREEVMQALRDYKTLQRRLTSTLVQLDALKDPK